MNQPYKRDAQVGSEMKEKLSLAESFDKPSFGHWRQEANRLLGSTPEAAKRTQVELPDFDWQPIFTREDADPNPASPHISRSKRTNGWTVLQEIPYPDPDRFNENLRHALDHGLTGILLRLDRAGRFGIDPDLARVGEVGFGGLAISTVQELAAALDGIPLDRYPIHLDCGANPLVGVSLLTALLKGTALPLHQLRGRLIVDPMGLLAEGGTLPTEITQVYDEMAEALRWSNEIENFGTVNISMIPYHEAGLSAPEQLGCLLATGLAYLREMESRSIPPEQLQKELSFSLSVGSNLFIEIAKGRAVRSVWSRLMELAEIPISAGFPDLHLQSLDSSRTQYDQHINMLRGTAEAFAAIVGGCDSLTIKPLDSFSGLPDQFSLRMARNTQLILAEESHLGAVIDPAGGSYYIEQLTDSIAEQAWEKFGEIETMGGMLHALQSGLIHHWIADRVALRSERLVHRQDLIVGTSKYINVAEGEPTAEQIDLEKYHDRRQELIASHKSSSQREIKPEDWQRLASQWSKERGQVIERMTELAERDATVGELAGVFRQTASGSVQIGPLTPFRPSEIFEHLRGMVDGYRRKHGDQPRIDLVAIGQGNGLQARIEFVRDYFAVASYQTEFEKTYADVTEAVEAVKQNRPALIVLIAADEDYPEIVPEFCRQIKADDRATIIVLAGRPKEQLESFTEAGVSEFIFDGTDVCASLMGLSQLMGMLP